MVKGFQIHAQSQSVIYIEMERVLVFLVNVALFICKIYIFNILLRNSEVESMTLL